MVLDRYLAWFGCDFLRLEKQSQRHMRDKQVQSLIREIKLNFRSLDLKLKGGS